MILIAILNSLTDHYKTVATSITGAVIADVAPITSLQTIGTFVAIIAGVMTVVNLFIPLRSFYDKYKAKHEKANSK